jgi:hypothetical protein
MTLPDRFPFSVVLLYNGEPLPEITEESHKEFIKTLDPYFDLRKEAEGRIVEKVLNPLVLFLHKYHILKKVLEEKRPPTNITLLNIVQDALRQNVTDLSLIMSFFIDFINEAQGKFQELFKRQAQNKIIAVMLEVQSPEEQEVLQRRSKEIDLKRDKLFPIYSSTGNPSAECFKKLTDHIDEIRKIVRTYRDKICAHSDENKPTIHWRDLDASIEQFTTELNDFYVVLSFGREYGKAQGPGFLSEETLAILIKGTYDS